MSSTPVSPARAAALRVRLDLTWGLRLDLAFGREAPALDPRDRAFLHELSFGTCRLQGRLDHLLGRKVRGGLERLDAPVLEVLRLAAYQLFCMDGVPRYAAISQAVDQAKEVAGRGASGLVNAVLRTVADDGMDPALFPTPDLDPAGYLSTWGSHPRWLVERWLARWDLEDVEAFVRQNNERPVLTFVPLDVSVEEAVGALGEAGITGTPVGHGTSCVYLDAGTDPTEVLGRVNGIIQDGGANLVARYADIPPGTKVADLCAAPGGKALAAGGVCSFIVAADPSEVRMRLVRDNARRTGRPLGLVVADARHPPIRPVNFVLLDVPCTGTGTLRRHPDARWRLRPDMVDDLVGLQREILEGASTVVAPGGILLYSTCSLEPEENEDQVTAFLARHPDFTVEATHAVPPTVLTDTGHLWVVPWVTGFDGAFAARLRRAS